MIDISQEELLLLLLRSVLSGVALGVFYDALRIVRMALGGGKRGSGKRKKLSISRIFDFAVVFFSDLLFGICVGVLSVLLIYHANRGIFRGMVYGGMLVGFVLYRLSLSRLLMKVSEILINFVKKLLRKIIHIIFIPIKGLFRLVKYVYHLTIGKIIAKIVSRVKRAQRERRERRMKKQAEQELIAVPDAETHEGSDRGEYVYVNEKTAYKKEGRISFCKRE